MEDLKLEMENKRLAKEFKELLDRNEKEEVYQKFLEENPKLIPTQRFELNHFVHNNIIITKMPLLKDYKCDFFYLSKSSARWNVVFIELEKPSAKFFTSEGNPTQEFNRGMSQIKDWQTYFKTPEFKLAFKQDPIIKTLMSEILRFYDNEINFKYVLVIGRRKDLEDGNYYKKRDSYITDEIDIVTYDYLYEYLQRKSDRYVCRIKNNYLYIDTDKYIDNELFSYTDCSNIRVKQNLLNELKNMSERYKGFEPLSEYGFLGLNTENKLKLLEKNSIK